MVCDTFDLDRKVPIPTCSVTRMESAVSDRRRNEPGWGGHCVSLLHRLPSLIAGELFNSTRVAASFEGRVQSDVNDAESDLDGNHALPNGEDVGVIVTREFGRFVIPNKEHTGRL
jgi:hypothetical protein